MAIKKSRAIYVGGYDKEYFVDSMSNSHIINSIVQIREKIRVLEELLNSYGFSESGGVACSLRCLGADQNALLNELNSRDNCREDC